MILHELISYDVLRLFCWLLLGVLLVGFAVTDGFDLGAMGLLRATAKTDVERRTAINSVGPVWEGNQVWLILGGGAIFAAWPLIYATAFSGFYWAMMAALWALFFRPVGFKYRSLLKDAQWRRSWDWGLFVGGFVPPVIFGVAFGNLLQGVPFHFNELLMVSYTGSFWELLNPFALLAGIVSSAMITLQGAVYLAHRTEGAIQRRAGTAALWSAVLMVLGFVGAGLWLRYGNILGYAITSVVDPAALPNPLGKTVERNADGWWINYAKQPLLWLLPLLGIAGALLAAVLTRAGRTLTAFVLSSLAIVGVIGTAGAAMFPFLMPSSSHPDASLTVWDSVSSHLTLGVMFWATLIFMPLIIFYTGWAYRVMRGKITVEQIRANDHSAY